MAAAFVLIPALIALAMLSSSSPASRVAQKVYMPCLFLIPTYLEFRLGGLVLNVTSILALMLVLAALTTWNYKFKFSWVDLCVILFTFGSFYSDMNRGALKPGIYAFIFTFSKCMLPYFIGRLLIEQAKLRTEFATTLVLCLAFVGSVSVIEYVKAYNFFQNMAMHITHTNPGWVRQTRWGFGRIAGPYGHAIVAGMIFATAVLLQLWLVSSKSWSVTKLRNFGVSVTPVFITWAVCAGFFMTMSRGPWIGFVFGAGLTAIGFAKNRKRAATISITMLIILGSGTYLFLNKYTDTSVKEGDQDQQNAEYRRNLITVYQPLIEEGGLWGWGTPVFFNHGVSSWLPDHDSIDNEYIRISMAQGYWGSGLFVLIFALSALHLARLCASLKSKVDYLFAYCMLGIIVTIAFTLSTVYLGDPMTQVVFLLLGWSQSIETTRALEQTTSSSAAQRFAFERVFV